MNTERNAFCIPPNKQYGGIMSIKFDPTKSAALALAQASPNATFFTKWFALIGEGYLAETNPLSFCRRAWAHQSGKSCENPEGDFMQSCFKACEEYQRFCQWHRTN